MVGKRRKARRQAMYEDINKQFRRHDELMEAYVRFEASEGRPPTHRELWDICPPK